MSDVSSTIGQQTTNQNVPLVTAEQGGRTETKEQLISKRCRRKDVGASLRHHEYGNYWFYPNSL